MKRKLNLKQLIAMQLGYHIILKIVFFDEGSYHCDSIATVHYKVYANSHEEICFLGEGQIKELIMNSSVDKSIALSEFKDLFELGIAC